MAASEYLAWFGAFWNRETPEHRAEQGKETLSTLGVRLELGACQETRCLEQSCPGGPVPAPSVQAYLLPVSFLWSQRSLTTALGSSGL